MSKSDWLALPKHELIDWIQNHGLTFKVAKRVEPDWDIYYLNAREAMTSASLVALQVSVLKETT